MKIETVYKKCPFRFLGFLRNYKDLVFIDFSFLVNVNFVKIKKLRLLKITIKYGIFR